MKLVSDNGMVSYLYRAGRDMVKGSMPLEAAEKFIASHKSEITTDHKGYPLCVDGLWFFPEAPQPKRTSKKVSGKE